MGKIPNYGVKYWVSDIDETPCNGCGDWLYVGSSSKGVHVFEECNSDMVINWKYFTPAKVQLTTEEALRACLERLEAVGDTSDLIADARKALGE